MKRIFLAAAIGLVGCGGSGGGSTSPDMAMAGGGDVTMVDPAGTITKYVANSLLVPLQKTDYAIDLNGDTHPDNQLGNIIGALASAGNLDVQGSIDKSVAAGDVVLLLSLQAKDMTSADNVGVTIYLGMKQAMPDFKSGMGMFTIDASQMPAAFLGRIAGGKFASNNPVTTTHPVTMVLKLPLIEGVDPLVLKVNGAQVQFQTGATLMNGQIHGSIKKADIDGSIIPAVASLLSNKLAKDGCTAGGGGDGGVAAGDGGAAMCPATDMTIISLFDVGNCTNPVCDPMMMTPRCGMMAKAGDGVIDVCEVQNNNLVGGLLAPDIQVFDAMGNYKPNPANTTKDSLSLGLGFTAVGAKF